MFGFFGHFLGVQLPLLFIVFHFPHFILFYFCFFIIGSKVFLVIRFGVFFLWEMVQ